MNNELGMQEISEVLRFSDMVTFDFNGIDGMRIDEVISHLQGLQKISKSIPGLLEKLYQASNFKGVRCRLVGVDINKVEVGSLSNWLDLAVEVMIVGEASDETKTRVLEDIKKMSTGVKLGLLLGGITLGIIIKGCSDSGLSMNNVGGVQQHIAVNIGTSFNLPPEKVAPVLVKATKNSGPGTIQGAYDFISPAQNHGGNIRFSQGDLQSTIPDTIIKEVPRTYERKISQPHIEVVQGVELHIRALDMDDPTKGWSAVIPSVLPDKRFPIELAEDIDRSKLMRPIVLGDIEVTYQVKEASKKPTKIFLVKVYDRKADRSIAK